jgi:hypothetical protein
MATGPCELAQPRTHRGPSEVEVGWTFGEMVLSLLRTAVNDSDHGPRPCSRDSAGVVPAGLVCTKPSTRSSKAVPEGGL